MARAKALRRNQQVWRAHARRPNGQEPRAEKAAGVGGWVCGDELEEAGAQVLVTTQLLSAGWDSSEQGGRTLGFKRLLLEFPL